MLNILINAVFFIIGKVADVVFSPIMLVINSFLPSSFDFSVIFNFFDYAFTYFVWVLKFLMIDSSLIAIVVSVFSITLSIALGVRSFQFIIKIYNKFKP